MIKVRSIYRDRSLLYLLMDNFPGKALSRVHSTDPVFSKPLLPVGPGGGVILHPGDYTCDSPNIVYLLKCTACDNGFYVGETSKNSVLG